MAEKMSKAALLASRRAELAQQIRDYFISLGDDAQMTGSNKFMFPTLDAEGNELFAVVNVIIPRGEQGGPAYDGYAAAENYRFECQQAALRKEKREEEKRQAAEKRKAKQEERKRKKENEGE